MLDIIGTFVLACIILVVGDAIFSSFFNTPNFTKRFNGWIEKFNQAAEKARKDADEKKKK